MGAVRGIRARGEGMIELELTERSLIVHMRGIYRFLALRRRVECELAHVRAVSPGIPPR
jgi:hypothetical protein